MQVVVQKIASQTSFSSEDYVYNRRLTCAGCRLDDAGNGAAAQAAAEEVTTRGPRKPKKKSPVMARDLYDANGKIKPDLEDIEVIERQCGPLPANASSSQIIERHRLAAAVKLIRLYAEGKLPPTLMREMDSCISRN